MNVLSKIKISVGLLTLALYSDLATAELRPLSADRPDATESPQTVDAGHYQVETTLLGFSSDQTNNLTTETLIGFETNLKYGLSSSVDLQLVFTPYLKQTGHTSSHSTESVTHGDIEVRSKINLWGNDGLRNDALALLPYLKIPAGDLSNDHAEGGLIITYATNLKGYDVGFQAEIDYLYDEQNKNRDWGGSHTAVIGYEITSTTGGYLEYIGEYSLEDDYLPYASFGFTWQTTRNRQWDLGSKLALHDKAQDFEAFAGFTQRF